MFRPNVLQKASQRFHIDWIVVLRAEFLYSGQSFIKTIMRNKPTWRLWYPPIIRRQDPTNNLPLKTFLKILRNAEFFSYLSSLPKRRSVRKKLPRASEHCIIVTKNIYRNKVRVLCIQTKCNILPPEKKQDDGRSCNDDKENPPWWYKIGNKSYW